MNQPAPVWLPFAIIGAFCIGFPLFWMTIVTLIGKLGGWSGIAKVFPYDPSIPEPPGWHSWTSGSIGLTSYRSTMSVGPSEKGLHLSTVTLFRAGHPRVFVPWDQMEVSPPEDWFFITRTTVSFPGKGVRDVKLSGAAGEAVYKCWKQSRGEEA